MKEIKRKNGTIHVAVVCKIKPQKGLNLIWHVAACLTPSNRYFTHVRRTARFSTSKGKQGPRKLVSRGHKLNAYNRRADTDRTYSANGHDSELVTTSQTIFKKLILISSCHRLLDL